MLKKYLLIINFVTGLSLLLQAQDLIIKENGDMIQAKVIEIGTTEIKYKRFNNLTGPTYTILKSDLFLIKFENGTKEVFEREPIIVVQQPQQPVYTPYTQIVQPQMPTVIKEKKPRKNFFGLEAGIGKSKNKSIIRIDTGDIFCEDFETPKGVVLDIGVRWLHRFNPYIGWDIIRGKFNIYSDAINPQLMTGLRLYSPSFNKNMSFYGAGRLGGGFIVSVGGDYNTGFSGAGLCFEFEGGLNLTKKFFIAFAYNQQRGLGHFYGEYNDFPYSLKYGYSAFRLGFNF